MSKRLRAKPWHPPTGPHFFDATLVYKNNASMSARKSRRLVLSCTIEMRGSRGKISGAHVSEATAHWLQTMLAALVIVTIFSSGCAGGGSDAQQGACPPVVEYSRDEQASMNDEVAALPEGAVILEWLADYAVMREQARACANR